MKHFNTYFRFIFCNLLFGGIWATFMSAENNFKSNEFVDKQSLTWLYHPSIHPSIHPPTAPVPYFFAQKGAHAKLLYMCAPISCNFYQQDTNVQIFQLQFLTKFLTSNLTTQMLKIFNFKLKNFIITFSTFYLFIKLTPIKI